MKIVIEWLWNGPWWAPLVCSFYAAVILAIVFSPILSIMRTGRR
jgi:hypothetical protein